MPRLPRVHIQGALYYITSRGDNNQEIFKDKLDYLTYIDLLGKYKQQYGFKLYSFLLLKNHLHLLIELAQNSTISQIMHDLNSSYIKYFNSQHQRKGHLLQERYKLVLVEKESYLLPLTAYMHLNPCVLKLAKAPEEYPFTSFRNYAGGEAGTDTEIPQINLEEEIKEVLELLSRTYTPIPYKDYVSGNDTQQMQALAKKVHKLRILGSKEFTERVKTQIAKIKIKAPRTNLTSNKKFVLAGTSAVILLGLINVFLFTTNTQLKDDFSKLNDTKEKEYGLKLDVEKEKIKDDLEGLYKANMVSYEAMAKRLEIEKKKVKDLQDKLQ